MTCATKHRLAEGEFVARVLARIILHCKPMKPAAGIVLVLPVLEKYICHGVSHH